MGSVKVALVTEDHPMLREALVGFLKEFIGAIDVLQAESFDSALEIMAGTAVDLALFDLDVPGLGSARELEQIRRRWPLAKVVVFTGCKERDKVLAALEAGVHGYVIKTTTLDHLAVRLGYILAGEIYVPSFLAEPNGIAPEAEARRDSKPRSPLDNLTERQVETLRCLVDGLPNREICAVLNVKEGTVKLHVANVIKKLGARSRTHAAAMGRKMLD